MKAKKILKTNHGILPLPAFFPDGTLGVVRGVDTIDLENAGVDGIVINAYHLLANSTVDKEGAESKIRTLMKWDKPMVTDSGGFQVMSLIHKNPKLGKIKEDKIIFRTPGGATVILTPEKSIQAQFQLGADIMITLDDCTKPDQSLEDQEKSVERTIRWAKKCKEEFEKEIRDKEKRRMERVRPLLFAVIQGGNNKKLRKYCAEELNKIGFDGYCYGGFPVEKGRFLKEIVEYTAKLMPDDKPKYAMGVGKPEDIVACVKMGYGLFDCVIPTREARHKKLYIFNSSLDVRTKSFYSTIYIGSGKYQESLEPISRHCDCYTCQNYYRAYLYHLFKIGDSLAVRLATIHNLRFYSTLLKELGVGFGDY